MTSRFPREEVGRMRREMLSSYAPTDVFPESPMDEIMRLRAEIKRLRGALAEQRATSGLIPSVLEVFLSPPTNSPEENRSQAIVLKSYGARVALVNMGARVRMVSTSPGEHGPRDSEGQR